MSTPFLKTAGSSVSFSRASSSSPPRRMECCRKKVSGVGCQVSERGRMAIRRNWGVRSEHSTSNTQHPTRKAGFAFVERCDCQAEAETRCGNHHVVCSDAMSSGFEGCPELSVPSGAGQIKDEQRSLRENALDEGFASSAPFGRRPVRVAPGRFSACASKSTGLLLHVDDRSWIGSCRLGRPPLRVPWTTSPALLGRPPCPGRPRCWRPGCCHLRRRNWPRPDATADRRRITVTTAQPAEGIGSRRGAAPDQLP